MAEFLKEMGWGGNEVMGSGLGWKNSSGWGGHGDNLFYRVTLRFF